MNETERRVLIQDALAKLKSEFPVLKSACKIESTIQALSYSGFTATIEGQFHLCFWCGFNKYFIDLSFTNPNIAWISVKASTLDEAIAKLTEEIDQHTNRLKPWGSDRHANN